MQEISQEITKEKKKREKPVAMSLSEFRQTATSEGIQCVPKSENSQCVTGLDSFSEWPDDSTTAVTRNHERSNIQGQITTGISCHSFLVPQSSLVCFCWQCSPYLSQKSTFHVSFKLKKQERRFARQRNAVSGKTSHRRVCLWLVFPSFAVS